MHVIVKDGLVLYVDATLTADGTRDRHRFDPTTTTANAFTVQVDELPKYFAAGRWQYVDGALLPLPDYEAEMMSQARRDKLAEILYESDRAMGELTAKYSLHEKLSWPKQEAEAKSLQADPEAEAPMLRGLAQARGIDVLVLRDKVLANVAAYEAAAANIIGLQQVYETAVKAAATLADVEAVTVSYVQG